jgi:hypothetical protein
LGDFVDAGAADDVHGVDGLLDAGVGVGAEDGTFDAVLSTLSLSCARRSSGVMVLPSRASVPSLVTYISGRRFFSGSWGAPSRACGRVISR